MYFVFVLSTGVCGFGALINIMAFFSHSVVDFIAISEALERLTRVKYGMLIDNLNTFLHVKRLFKRLIWMGHYSAYDGGKIQTIIFVV